MTEFSPAISDFLALADDARRIGPYRCTVLLDKAGSAPVFQAVEEHAGLSLREVAVKVFDIGRSRMSRDVQSMWQTRVIDEARSLCRVQHPNVIRFHTLCTDQERGLMGLVMEFARGVSLDKQLEGIPAGDARRIALVVDVGLAVASALAAAHEAGIVHRNVKPSNVMFTDGAYKLINFGIAASQRPSTLESLKPRGSLDVEELSPESIGRRASTLEKPGGQADAPLTGTVGYTDPVCLKTTSAPNTASDLYSLGATLYQCLVGDVPALATPKHAKKPGVDAGVLVGDAPAASIADVAPWVPPALAKLVDALVSTKREGRPRSADAVARAMERIRSALAGHERELPPEDRGPFPGLERFEAADRDVFFGRAAEIAGVLELARSRGVVGIVGLSGSGKSSLLRAGVVPAVEEGALGSWPKQYRSVVVDPGRDPMKTIGAALAELLGVPVDEHPEAIVQQLAANVDEKGKGILLAVDHLEEIVTLHDSGNEAGRLALLELLSRLAEAPAGIRVVVTIRRDRLDEILALDAPFARALSRGVQLLGPLSSTGWEEVADLGLEAYGYAFEDAELRRETVADLRGHESAMPLVAFGLSRLWAERDKKKKRITKASFKAQGGMRGALEQHADFTVDELGVKRDVLRDLVLAMTTPEGTRQHVKLESLKARFGEDARKAVVGLTKAHLVAEDHDGVTLVHDSLLREWGLARRWIEEARDDRLLSDHLERDAGRWAGSRDVAELWRKGRLAAALDLQKRGTARFTDDARAFLEASVQDERKGQMVFWGGVVLIVSLVVGGALWNAKQSAERADQARKDADALAAALTQVKELKRQVDENAAEAHASATLLHQLQQKIESERAAFAAQVTAAMKKVDDATSLDTAKHASDDLKANSAPTQNTSIALPDLGSAGPRVGDTPGPGPATAGTFDQAAIERVVNTQKASVKRMCLDRGNSTASTTKVTATLTIAPSGAVQGVTTAGDDPMVAKCIENKLQSWSFPPPGEEKKVQIPFVFVRQG